MRSIDDILKHCWGYDNFRPLQREIIESVLQGADTLALLPTGGGKSLTYQVPALVLDGLTVVVTPLVALMQDQVARLQSLGIAARAIYSGLSSEQLIRALDDCIYGDVKLVYISPERLTSEPFKARLRSAKISLIAVDEAHCISQWGYDFRPNYLNIGVWREEFAEVPILALTATATKRVCGDIMKRLNFRGGRIMCGSFDRPNLAYVVRETTDKVAEIEKILSAVGGSAIVYARTRSSCEQLAAQLTDAGFKATYYHAGVDHELRTARQQAWLSDEVRVMVATNAFGMGVDKGGVRVVIHLSMCDSLEAYYQEAGRAGRDGAKSYAVLLTSPKDREKILKNIDDEFPEIDKIRDLYDRLCQWLQLEYGMGQGMSFAFDVKSFCCEAKVHDTHLRRVVRLLDMNGYMTLGDEVLMPLRVQFAVSRHDLYSVRSKSPSMERVVEVMMRLYEGIFTTFQIVNLERIAKECNYSTDRVGEVLKQMSRMRIIDYRPSGRSAVLHLGSARVAKRDLFISPESYLHRRNSYVDSFQRVVEYAENRVECRSQLFAQYFGVEDKQRNCGICDNCLDKKR